MNPQQWKFALGALRLQQTIPVKQSLFTETLKLMQYSAGPYVCSSVVVFERETLSLIHPVLIANFVMKNETQIRTWCI